MISISEEPLSPENTQKMKKVSSVVGFFCFVFLCLLSENNAQSPTSSTGICAMPGCNCTFVVHHWINVKCVFTDYQDVELHEGTIPVDASEVSVSRCRELRIHSGAFTGGAQLKRVHVTGIHSVVAKRQAFQNISAPNPLLEVSECNRVVLESYAFKNARGTLSVSISRCKHVEIKPNAFSWLLRFSVREVPTLDLASNAFHFDAPPYGRHGPATKIMFQSVKITELSSSVFPSAAAEIRMDDVWTRVIRKDAFSAITFLAVMISNASIFEIESGAFREATVIDNFELVDVRIQTIKTGAFRAGFTNFTIQYSRIDELEEGAMDMTAAIATFRNNEFENLHSSSIVLKAWSRVSIDQNLFKSLEKDAIVADEMKKPTPEYPRVEFTFLGNRIINLAEGSLRFVTLSQQVSNASIGSIYFEKPCQCPMDSWLTSITSHNSSISWMMVSSYCIAGSWLENCLNVPQGYLLISTFNEKICSPKTELKCMEPSETPAPSVKPPSVGPHVYPRQKGYFDVEMSDPERQREQRLVVMLSVAATFVVVALILAAGVVAMRRRGCPKISAMSLSGPFAPGMTDATSISRVSVHEYLRPEAARTEEVDEFTYSEHKATQTLPEELTEEYLRDLRERLNDPDNYSQARDMIEHLYDLIKVEESCNNNNDDNMYDVVAPRRRTRCKNSVDVGTKAPSLERLLPNDRTTKPAIAEYTEPRDRTSDQNHLYAELPGDETVPSTSRLTRAPLPLPPDVVSDVVEREDNVYAEARIEKQRVNANFLKALGESILGGKKRPSSLLSEYADPSDSAAHLYSELELSSRTHNKMANRPLPVKPEDASHLAM